MHLEFVAKFRDFRRFRCEGQRDIDERGALVVFVLDLQLVVPRRGVEERVPLDRFRGLDPSEISDVLRHAGAVGQLREALAGVVLDGQVRHGDLLAAAIHCAHEDEEIAILRNTGVRRRTQLREPLGFVHRIDDMAQRNSLAHRIRTYGVRFFFFPAG